MRNELVSSVLKVFSNGIIASNATRSKQSEYEKKEKLLNLNVEMFLKKMKCFFNGQGNYVTLLKSGHLKQLFKLNVLL